MISFAKARIGIVLAQFVVTGFSGIAAKPVIAAILCARPKADGSFNTTVRIREACRAGEIELTEQLQGPVGPSGPPGPAGAEGPPGPPPSPVELLISNHSCPGCNLEDAALAGADLNSAVLARATLRGSNVSGTNLANADLGGADLRDVVYDAATRCPSGEFVDDDGVGSGTPYGFKIACALTKHSVEIVVDFKGPQSCQICGGVNGTCTNDGSSQWRTFQDPTPPGAIVYSASVRAFGTASGDCGKEATAHVNDAVLDPPSAFMGVCGCGNCSNFGPVAARSLNGQPLPGWNKGGANILRFQDPGGYGGQCYVEARVTLEFIEP